MSVTVNVSTAKGIVEAPTSKSMAHRMLICAALADGVSEITKITYSQDVLATIDCLREMGAKIEIKEDKCIVEGVKTAVMDKQGVFNCRESGSTLRFFIPLLLLSNHKQIINGSSKLLSRPLSVYEKICKDNNLLFETGDCLTIQGPLNNDEYTVEGNISSQFITGLLFSLSVSGKVGTIHLIPPVESKSYIDMTMSAMKNFGINSYYLDENTIVVDGSKPYKAVNTAVEGDYSGAAFLEAFNYMGGNVKVTGLWDKSLQGDKAYLDYFPMLDKGYCDIDVANCPDLAPVLMMMAAYKHGAHFINTYRLKLKESDRAEVMKEELAKFGAQIEVNDNDVIVYESKLHCPEVLLAGHNDHRIVMSLVLLASKLGGTIDDEKAVSKSFPDFFEVITNLGIEVQFNDN